MPNYSRITYKGLSILTPDPQGAGGDLVQDNTKAIADSIEAINDTIDGLTTSDVAEGSNLYFTDLRAAAAAPVQSVAGRTGTVTLVSADITDATAANTANKIVLRDSSGNFVTSGITADGLNIISVIDCPQIDTDSISGLNGTTISVQDNLDLITHDLTTSGDISIGSLSLGGDIVGSSFWNLKAGAAGDGRLDIRANQVNVFGSLNPQSDMFMGFNSGTQSFSLGWTGKISGNTRSTYARYDNGELIWLSQLPDGSWDNEMIRFGYWGEVLLTGNNALLRLDDISVVDAPWVIQAADGQLQISNTSAAQPPIKVEALGTVILPYGLRVDASSAGMGIVLGSDGGTGMGAYSLYGNGSHLYWFDGVSSIQLDSGAGSPGGSTNDLQINDGAGGFAGGGPSWNSGELDLYVPGSIHAGTIWGNGSELTNLFPGYLQGFPSDSSKVLLGDGTWGSVPGASPGGSSGDIQINNGSGGFSGGGPTFDGSTLYVPAYVEVGSTYGYKVNGTKVVDAQQSAISDSVGGDESTKINEILSALRSHGLIAN